MSTATADHETVQLEDLLEEIRVARGMDAPDGSSPSSFRPRVKPSSAPAQGYAPVEHPAQGYLPVERPATETAPPPRSRALSRLLAMADMYLRAGSLRQALEMYFDLVRSHPDAPEALQAEERVLEVARHHEEAGELHSARAIYEQLI